jgi:glycosyltransferase involved in cell wall biosynthesis
MAVKIFLNMIVKNEARIIERCLNAVQWVDGVVISDTGSTDNTVELIESWLKTNDKLGAVVQNDWKNFGHNRTEALKEGRKWCSENGLDLHEVYFVLIDADMIFPAITLRDCIEQADLWDVRQQNASIIYHNLRVIRASLDVICKCPTHEYYDVLTKDATRKTYEGVIIEDIGDGGAKSDKIERDIRLLKEGLVEEPKNCRYWFYLANTYRDSGDFTNAILAYHQRIEIGGWYEETYCAHLYKGDCHKNLGQHKEAVALWLDAYQVDPVRSEALWRIAVYYRTIAKHHIAMLFIDKGLKMEQPTDRVLFLEKPVYEYQFLYEMSICGYYVNDKSRGKLACKMLLDKPMIPPGIHESVVNNMEFYK